MRERYTREERRTIADAPHAQPAVDALRRVRLAIERERLRLMADPTVRSDVRRRGLGALEGVRLEVEGHARDLGYGWGP